MRGHFFSICVCLLLSLTLQGQETSDVPLAIDSPNLTVDYHIGFGEFNFNDRLNSAVFRLHNQATNVLKGSVSVEQIYFSRGKIANRNSLGSTAVEIGQGAQQSVSLLYSPTRVGSMVASFRDDSGKILWQRYAFVEFIESRTARLHLWSVTPETTVLEAGPAPRGPISINPQQRQITPGTRPLYEAKIPAWGLPSDPRHLAFGDGIVLGQEALSRLTGAQESAIARYVAKGGVLLLPKNAQAFEKSLWERHPFAVTSLEGQEARFGSGRILRYPPTTMTHGQRSKNAWIYSAVDQTPRRFYPIITPAHHLRNGSPSFTFGERAMQSIQTCAWFAGLFILVTGPGSWLLRNLPRRRFLGFLSGAIIVFCIAAILLGFYLQQKKGSLRWTTVTEIAPQGSGIQTGVLDMESAGAHYHQVQTTDPQLHFLQPNAYWSRFDQAVMGSAPIPLLPWRSRAVVTESLIPNCLPIAVELAMVDPTKIRVTWANPNSEINISAIQLVVRSNQGRPADVFNPRLTKRARERQSHTHGQLYGNGTTLSKDSLDMILGWEGSSTLTDISIADTTDQLSVGASTVGKLGMLYASKPYAGLIIFQVDQSPGFNLDESKTSFVSSAGLHFVVQVLTEDMLPAHDTLFTSAPYPMTKPKSKSPSNRRRVIPR